jgi:hypothetical protein
MFFLLVAVVSLHQVYSTLTNKKDKWPLRSVALRLIEYIGRVFLLPFIIVYYFLRIDPLPATIVLPAAIIVVFIWYRESFGLWKITQVAIQNLIDKANHPDSKLIDFSKGEIFLLNYLLFHRISFHFQDIANHLLSKGQLDLKNPRDLSPNLRDVDEIVERERAPSMTAGIGIGIQLLGPSSAQQLRREAKLRRKSGADSDDEEEEEDMDQGQGQDQYGRGGGGYGKSQRGSGTRNIITSPVHRL